MRVFFALVFLSVPLMAPAQGSKSDETARAIGTVRAGVVVYDRTEFEGNSETYVRDMPDLTRSRLGDNAARSVRLARGCRVRLFQNPGFEGKHVELGRDTPTLKGSGLGLSQASSLQVRCGGAKFDDEKTQARGVAAPTQTKDPVSKTPALPQRGVTLFTGHGWKGTSRNVTGAVPDLKATSVGYDARSLHIAEGCSVQVFSGTNFSGQMTEFYRSVSNLSSTRVRSLNVRCGGTAAPVLPGTVAKPTPVPTPSAPPGSAPAPAKGVTLFETPNWQDRNETFTGNVSDLSRSRLGDDVARSIAVAEGCYVELYELSNYRGTRAFVDKSMNTLAGTAVGNKAVSSLRVQCDINPCGDVQSCTTLYSEFDYGGQQELLTADVPDLRYTDLGDRRARSLRVSDGCTVELFSQPDYRGEAESFTRDEPRLDRSRIGADRASSLRFYCGAGYPGPGSSGGRGVTLYEHKEFGGISETFTSDVLDLQGTRIGPDQASSARVDSGCRAWLYDETEYYGQYSLIERDEPFLRDLNVGSDRVRSLRVECY